MPRARNCTIATPSAAARAIRSHSSSPTSCPSASTSTVPTTVATMTTPSLTLIELSRSSGRIGLERVADPVHRAHVARPELAPQPAHVGVHGALAGSVAIAPHVGEELLARVDDAGAGGEEREEVELGRREVHVPALHRDAPRRGVELQHTDAPGLPERR